MRQSAAGVRPAADREQARYTGAVGGPQQRNTEDAYGGELPPEQSYPYDGNGNGNNGTNGGNGQQGGGYDEQYRF